MATKPTFLWLMLFPSLRLSTLVQFYGDAHRCSPTDWGPCKCPATPLAPWGPKKTPCIHSEHMKGHQEEMQSDRKRGKSTALTKWLKWYFIMQLRRPKKREAIIGQGIAQEITIRCILDTMQYGTIPIFNAPHYNTQYHLLKIGST